MAFPIQRLRRLRSSELMRNLVRETTLSPNDFILPLFVTSETDTDRPIAAYHVSGETAMIRTAGEQGFLDAEMVMMESLMCIKRAGANMIITYSALDAIARL